MTTKFPASAVLMELTAYMKRMGTKAWVNHEADALANGDLSAFNPKIRIPVWFFRQLLKLGGPRSMVASRPRRVEHFQTDVRGNGSGSWRTRWKTRIRDDWAQSSCKARVLPGSRVHLRRFGPGLSLFCLLGWSAVGRILGRQSTFIISLVVLSFIVFVLSFVIPSPRSFHELQTMRALESMSTFCCHRAVRPSFGALWLISVMEKLDPRGPCSSAILVRSLLHDLAPAQSGALLIPRFPCSSCVRVAKCFAAVTTADRFKKTKSITTARGQSRRPEKYARTSPLRVLARQERQVFLQPTVRALPTC